MTDRALTVDDTREPDEPEDTLVARFKRSPETDAVLALLREAEVGATVTYEQMRQAAKIDEWRARLVSRRAVSIALNEFGRVFWNLEDVGYQRLSDSEIARVVGPDYRRRVGRASRKAKRRLAAVKNFAKLTADEQAKWTTAAVLASLGEQLASVKTAEKVRLEVDQRPYTFAIDYARGIAGKT